jgi:hypothetical protein
MPDTATQFTAADIAAAVAAAIPDRDLLIADYRWTGGSRHMNYPRQVASAMVSCSTSGREKAELVST